MAAVAADVLLVALHTARARADDGNTAVVVTSLECHNLGRRKAEEEEVEVGVLNEDIVSAFADDGGIREGEGGVRG